MRCSNMVAEFKKGEKQGGILAVTRTVSLPKTCIDNYGALYCKVRTLRLDFAWEAAIAVALGAD